MKEIRYRYCLDKDTNELIYVGDLTEETRYNYKYVCLECGREMEANMGPIRRRYFSHASGNACNGESYLHKLAKKRIKLKFESSDCFPVTFVRDVLCSEYQSCVFKDDYFCKFRGENITYDLKTWNNKPLYDCCQEEVPYGGFKPDLLLTSKVDSNLPSIFIEVFKTHESSESKLSSNFKIIETHQIKSEADIDDIIERGFIENSNCKFIGFKPNIKKKRKTDLSITRVVISPEGTGVFLNHGEVKCGMMNKKYNPKSIFECNVLSFPVLHENSSSPTQLLPTQVGLVWAVKKGMQIKNCMLCNSYKFNVYYGKYICIKYKNLGQKFMFPKQYYAKECKEYAYSYVLDRCTLADLQVLASEVIEK